MFDTLFTTLNALPVNAIKDGVAKSFATGSIPIVTSEVASGKTLLLPAACAEAITDDPDDNIVYVLEPTRFLSNNAAETLRSILGPEEGNLVGCLNANRSDDESITHPDNRVVFTTCGFALASGLVQFGRHFILDEAHETSIDLSLIKALLHKRLSDGDQISVAVLSATLDLDNEMDYWENPIHFETKGSAYPVDFHHVADQTIGMAVMDMINKYDRKGILVFVSGVEEIREVADEIQAQLIRSGINGEIATAHGNSTSDERKKASALPKAKVKILIGTNILESGINLPWVDAGVSSGDTKVMHVSGNMRKLLKEALPKWRIQQQMGRVARFCPGVFMLAHSDSMDKRPLMSVPDMARLPLTELVMNVLNYPEIRIDDLTFSGREQPKDGAIREAITTLSDYGLVGEDELGHLFLTNDGDLTKNLPISYQSCAAIAHAAKLDMVGMFLPLITMLDIGDVRQNYKDPLSWGGLAYSDMIHQVRILANKIMPYADGPFRDFKDQAEYNNLSIRKFREYRLLLSDLEVKTGCRANWDPYLDGPEDTHPDVVLFNKRAKEVLFKAYIRNSYPAGRMGRYLIPQQTHQGVVLNTADQTNTSVASTGFGDGFCVMASGTIRMIVPKDARRNAPFAVIEGATLYTKNDILHLIEVFGRDVFIKISKSAKSSIFTTRLDEILFPNKVEDDDYLSPLRARRQKPSVVSEVEEKKPEKTTGSLGDLLTQAMKKK